MVRPFQYIWFPKIEEKSQIHERQNFDSPEARNKNEVLVYSSTGVINPLNSRAQLLQLIHILNQNIDDGNTAKNYKSAVTP
jgi:hypothetical protein